MTLRTRNETLDFMLAELNSNRLGAVKNGSCVYEDDVGKHCVIGCLFTSEQHAKIQKAGLNNSSVEALILSEYKVAAGGLNFEEIDALQSAHDYWAHTADSACPISVARKGALVQTILNLKDV